MRLRSCALALLMIVSAAVSAAAQTISINGVAAPDPVTVVAGTRVPLTVANAQGNRFDQVGIYRVSTSERVAVYYLNGSWQAPATGLTSAAFSPIMPLVPGVYEWRLITEATTTVLATSGAVTVTASPATLSVNGVSPPTAVTLAGGSQATVTLADGPGLAYDTIVLMRLGTPDVQVDWRFVNNTYTGGVAGVTSATITFGIPPTPGSYEFRYMSEGGGVVTTRPVMVTSTTTLISINGVAAPAPGTVVAGTRVPLTVANASGNRFDQVGLHRVSTGERVAVYYLNGSWQAPATGLTSAAFSPIMPLAPGVYEWRLITEATTTVLATSGAVTVTASPATLSVNAIAPPTVTLTGGSQATVTLADGPGLAYDTITFVRLGSPEVQVDWRFVNNTYTGGVAGVTAATLTFGVPATSGSYEFRYVSEGGGVVTKTAATVGPPLSTPTLSIGSGTYAEEKAVVVSSVDAGVALHYTQDGTAPSESSATIASGATITITQSSTLKVRAFKSGLAPSDIVAATYLLAVAAPQISPATATFTTPQSVAITTATAGAMIRYTVDGSEPSSSSALYSQVLVIDATTTLKAKAFRSNWADSAVASSQLTIDPGTLSTPVASPAGGWIRPAQTIALIADPGTEIRYTLDGTVPSATSSLYGGPITIPSDNKTLRARAFRTNWTTSTSSFDLYRFDATVPSITARQFPLAVNGWHVTPVTVSFDCTDAHEIATCPTPITVSTEGAGQIVSATAVDAAGNESSSQQTLNLDFTPPVVTLSSPQDRIVTTNVSVVLTGTASDALSGLAAVKCNGAAATLDAGAVSCTVALNPGRNDIVISAIDVAGNSASAGVTVMRGSPTPTYITLTPRQRRMLPGETATLSLRDTFGMRVVGAEWISYNPEVVSLSNDDPPVLTALAPGNAYLEAGLGDNYAGASITVDDEGDPIPDGATKWDTGYTDYDLVDTDRILTHSIDADGPDAFRVMLDSMTSQRVITPFKIDSGETDWVMTTPDVPLMGDNYGGLIAGTERSTKCPETFSVARTCYTALVRFAGPATTASWRYESRGALERPAQGYDGTVYFVETVGTSSPEKSIVMLDGATGQVAARVPLVNSSETTISTTCHYASFTSFYEPPTLGPIVNRDGLGYMLTVEPRDTVADVCVEGVGLVERTFPSVDSTVKLLRLSKDGVVGEQIINTQHHATGTLWGPPTPRQLVPDGLGGLLIIADYWTGDGGISEKRVTRLDVEGNLTERTVPYGTRIELVGQEGTLYLNELTQSNNPTPIEKKAVDVTTWATKWTLPTNYSWLAASPDGGAVVSERAQLSPYVPPYDQLTLFGATGQIAAAPSMYLDEPTRNNGAWIGTSGGVMSAVAGTPFDDATRWDSTYRSLGTSHQELRRYASGTNQNQSRLPGIGIWLKTHSVMSSPIQHTSLRITPFEQAWLKNNASSFEYCPGEGAEDCRHLGKDVYGNVFLTMGAGSGTADTNPTCTGTLTKGYLRTADVTANAFNPDAFIELPVPILNESFAIGSLRLAFDSFQNNLFYNCFPETFVGFYNSNSFTHGLLHAAGIKHPEKPPKLPAPGWWTPVPPQFFPFQQ